MTTEPICGHWEDEILARKPLSSAAAAHLAACPACREARAVAQEVRALGSAYDPASMAGLQAKVLATTVPPAGAAARAGTSGSTATTPAMGWVPGLIVLVVLAAGVAGLGSRLVAPASGNDPGWIVPQGLDTAPVASLTRPLTASLTLPIAGARGGPGSYTVNGAGGVVYDGDSELPARRGP